MATDQDPDAPDPEMGNDDVEDQRPATPPSDDAGDDAENDTSLKGLRRELAKERARRRDAEGWRSQHESVVNEAKARADKDKSEAQKLTEALESERTSRVKAEAKLLRYEVAAAKGVPSKLMRFLSGDSREELEEAADALLAELNESKTAIPSRPKERLSNGQRSSTGDDRSLDELADEIFGS